jgi:hypothetical protein
MCAVFCIVMEIYVDYYDENAEIGNPRLVGLKKVGFQETLEKRPWPPSNAKNHRRR